jgi:glycosyltransferase involved in cell wall biosynthesis
MARLKLDGRVEFVSSTSNPYREMARFDVFTLPSREESFPLVVLEAMTLGRPVVAFDVGGVRDQMGDCGRIVESGDTSAMATAVQELLEDPAMRRDLGERARERARARFGIGPFRDAVRRLIGDLG